MCVSAQEHEATVLIIGLVCVCGGQEAAVDGLQDSEAALQEQQQSRSFGGAAERQEPTGPVGKKSTMFVSTEPGWNQEETSGSAVQHVLKPALSLLSTRGRRL